MKRNKYMFAFTILAILTCIFISAVIFLQQKSFGKLPSGERLDQIIQSPNYKDGQFQNLQPTELMTGQKSRWQALWEFITTDRSNLYPTEAITSIKTDLKKLSADKNLMVWFGHSSYLLQLDNKKILVDPVFDAASPVSFINKAFIGTEIYNADDMPNIDYLIITHDHWDHLDYQTIKALQHKVKKVICPLGVGEHFEYWGYAKEQLIELDWNEEASFEDKFTIYCLPARHFSGRGLTANQSLWASFLLKTPSLSLFIGGDSGYGIHFEQISTQHPNIDWAILENGQYSNDWKYIHTMPNELAKAAKDLKAKHIITVHHSKYALSNHTWDEPLFNEIKLKQDLLDIVTTIIGKPIDLDRN